MSTAGQNPAFPFLFGGAFIEAGANSTSKESEPYFPFFWEGLSLRLEVSARGKPQNSKFPFLLGRAFIEARWAGKCLSWVF